MNKKVIGAMLLGWPVAMLSALAIWALGARNFFLMVGMMVLYVITAISIVGGLVLLGIIENRDDDL